MVTMLIDFFLFMKILFRCVRISIRGLVRRLVRRLVGPPAGPSVMLSSKSMKNGLLPILNDLDSAGRGKNRDEKEGGTKMNDGATALYRTVLR